MRMSPLTEAAAQNDCKAIKELISAGASDEDRAAAVLSAAKSFAGDALELLVEGGAGVGAKEEDSGLTAVHYACR